MDKKYKSIAEHYENCLKLHGDNHLGVDWPQKEDAEKRYKVMLDLIEFDSNKGDENDLLDFGCGASHLYEYIQKYRYDRIKYSGLDISESFIMLSKSKYPHNEYYCADILDTGITLRSFDYIIMNGVFTEKVSLDYEEMLNYFMSMIKKVFQLADRGVAFNVMSKDVDWERDDLFHLPMDVLSRFLTKEVTRHFIIRNDYGLYEYTTYLYKNKNVL